MLKQVTSSYLNSQLLGLTSEIVTNLNVWQFEMNFTLKFILNMFIFDYQTFKYLGVKKRT